MQIKTIVSGIAALALVAGLAINVSAEEKGENEKPLALADVPAAVQSAIKQFAGSNPIERISKESEDNKTIFEAAITINGSKQAIEVFADGTVNQTEKQVSLKDVPDPVQAAIKSLAGSGSVYEIVEETSDGKKNYEVEVTVNGKKREVHIDANGKIEKDEGKCEHKGHGDKD